MRAYRYWMLTAVALLVCGGGVLPTAQTPDVTSGTWAMATAAMGTTRAHASATRLQSGRVLIAGGVGTHGTTATAEVFDAATGFSPAAPMNVARSRHVAVLLANGRVLVVGGADGAQAALASVEIYDPAANQWTVFGSLLEPRAGATAVLLADGRVLVAGGDDGTVPSSTAELLNPDTGEQAPAGAMSARRTGHAAAILGDGRVLIAGGFDGTSPVTSADVFDPATGAITPTGNLTVARAGLTATTLMDGRVLVVGGSNGSADLASAEQYDATAGTFTLLAAWLRTRGATISLSGSRTTTACSWWAARPREPAYRRPSSSFPGPTSFARPTPRPRRARRRPARRWRID